MENQENTSVKKSSSLNTKAVVIIVAGLLIAGGIFFFSGLNFGNSDREAVAIIGNESITRGELNQQIAQLEASGLFQIPARGSAERAQFETTLTEQLVYERLLRNEAISLGLTASQAEIDTEYNNLVVSLGGEETLERELRNAGISTDKLKEDIGNQIIMNKYYNQLAETNNITVSDEEIEQFFNEQVGDQEGLTLEMVSEQISNQLLQQKLEGPLSATIERLLLEQEVEFLI